MSVQYKILLLSLAVAAGPVTEAQTQHGKKAAQGGHAMFKPADLKWSDGPASLPAGAKMAVLTGDPSKQGPFTMRVRLPANYRIPAHTHPADEHVTVISGSFHMGLGDKLDTAKGQALPPGGFAHMAQGTRHFAWTSEAAEIQLHGMGPWGINYVNPADDPRRKSSR